MIMEHSAPQLIVNGAMILLGFVVIPIWLAMGLADYFCHRTTDIEHTSGTRESVLHLVQFGLVGLPLTAALFLQVNAGLLMVMAVAIMLHHAVAYIDVRYANANRDVLPIEQMIHSFLELLPIAAFLLLVAVQFGQVQALFGMGAQHADFAIRLRNPPLPAWYVGSVLLTALLANFGPYIEELIRCVRADPLAAKGID
jgi:hypothetical protein